MRTQQTSSLFLLAMLLIASVNAALPTVPDNPYCPASGNVNLEIESSPELPTFDVYGYYWDEETDNTADLFLSFPN